VKASAENGPFVVSRTVRVAGSRSADCAAQIEAQLMALAGVKGVGVEPDQGRVRVRYDAAQVGFGVLEQSLAEAGYPPTQGWWARWKSRWYCYLDDNARLNAQASPSACCSKPTDVFVQRRRR